MKNNPAKFRLATLLQPWRCRVSLKTEVSLRRVENSAVFVATSPKWAKNWPKTDQICLLEPFFRKTTSCVERDHYLVCPGFRMKSQIIECGRMLTKNAMKTLIYV